MNKHILFVIDHLENPGKYTQAELLANKESAARAAESAAATDAAYYAYYRVAYAAAYSVAEYFKINGEDKQTYIDELGE